MTKASQNVQQIIWCIVLISHRPRNFTKFHIIAMSLPPPLDTGLTHPSPPLNVSSLPPPPPSQASSDQTSGPRRSWRRQHCAGRFQTQPITVDEVEMARSRRDRSTTPETPIRPNQFLHSFSTATGSVCKSSENDY